MCENNINLPQLIEFNDFGEYDAYENALLEVYEADLWKGGITFNGLNVIPRVHKRFTFKDKTLDWTFAHFTTKGDIEEKRELDLRRCERIGWVKPIIENAHLDCVKVWENERNDKKGNPIRSVVLWYETENCKIVLTKRNGRHGEYYVITTFYLINSSHKIRKHNEEYTQYVQENGAYEVKPPPKKQ